MSQTIQERMLGSIYQCGIEPQIIQDMHLDNTVLLHVYSEIESLRKNGSNPNLSDLFDIIYSTLQENIVKNSSMLDIYH